MRRRSSSSNSSVDTCDRALGLVGRSAYPWAGRWGCSGAVWTPALGFPTGQDGVDAAGCPGQLVFQHGVGARAGLAHAVLDVGQRAHGELQAVGQVGAVAVAQRYAPTHDVVAEPFQGASIHEVIMTHQGGNVESPCPFRSVRRTNSGSYFLGTPASSALTWVTVSQKSLLHLLLGPPDHLDLGHPGQFPAHHLGLGQRLAGPPLLADGEVVEPFALVGVPQLPATLG